jgi:hypothetical protein
MPYIRPEQRERALRNPENAGELNFAFTMLIKEYLGATPNYQRFNDVLGALEGAKLEMARRKLYNYENMKIAENGDCY